MSRSVSEDSTAPKSKNGLSGRERNTVTAMAETKPIIEIIAGQMRSQVDDAICKVVQKYGINVVETFENDEVNTYIAPEKPLDGSARLIVIGNPEKINKL